MANHAKAGKRASRANRTRLAGIGESRLMLAVKACRHREAGWKLPCLERWFVVRTITIAGVMYRLAGVPVRCEKGHVQTGKQAMTMAKLKVKRISRRVK